MTFTERYEGVFLTEKEVAEQLCQDYSFRNNVIEDIKLKVTGHFGNCVSVDIWCDRAFPTPLYNSTHNIGYIIRALVEFLDKDRDGGVCLDELIGTPIRLIYDNKNPDKGKCVGIGHYMKDRFVFTDKLLTVKE